MRNNFSITKSGDMTRKTNKRKTGKKINKKQEISKDKLPYIPPAHKTYDIDKDMNNIIYPIDLDESPPQDNWSKKLAKFSNRLKYKFMKRFNMPEIYADIIFFIFEFLIAVGFIYLIMVILIILKKPS